MRNDEVEVLLRIRGRFGMDSRGVEAGHGIRTSHACWITVCIKI